jgi:aspartyl-tRNA(Asn)/glutamyl-tRNA(Gln) amidotransferase subunit A
MDINNLTIREAQRLLGEKELSSLELAGEFLKRIDETNNKLNSFLYVAREESLAQAGQADQMIADGNNLALTGIPGAMKDNILIKGIQATAGSKILENYVAPYDATVIKKLKNHGSVFLGKTNLDEFAMGSSTENSAFGPVKNPYDLSLVPGGSSGGSAVAVASSQALYALGSDTGGSVRQPASFCGVVGLKPTYGRVSRYGLIALGSSLDQIGVLAKNVEDCAIVFQAIAGQDELDSTTLSKPVLDFSEYLNKGVKGMRIGIPKEYFAGGIDAEVQEAVEAGIKRLEKLGAIVEQTSLPHVKYSLASYYIILPVEISANLSRYDGIRYGLSVKGESLEDVYYNTRTQGLGIEPKRRVMLGTFASSSGYYDAYYKKAKQVQNLIKQDFLKAFEKFDLLVTPVTPTTAFKVGEKASDPMQMYLADIFTVGLNIAGVPGMSVPVGLSKKGLPIGMQLIAPYFKEETLFQAGHAFELDLNTRFTPLEI